MKQIKLVDLSFYGDLSASKLYAPDEFRWYRGPNKLAGDDTVVFTDSCLPMVEQYNNIECTRIAWLVEPYVINPEPYKYIQENHHKFDYVFSHHRGLSEIIPNYVEYTFGGCWINENDWGAYDKENKITLIASKQNYAPGHVLRHQVVQQVGNVINVVGGGYEPFDHKIDMLFDSMYEIVIENCQVENYFTEKLIDSLLTHTLPIYWGSPAIGEIFNTDGMIIVNSLQDIVATVEKLMTGDMRQIYNDTVDARTENFGLAANYICCDNQIIN